MTESRTDLEVFEAAQKEAELSDAVARLATLPTPKPMSRCMTPHGGDCCPEYHALEQINHDMLAALRRIGSVLSTKKATINDDELWAAYSQVIATVAKVTGQ